MSKSEYLKLADTIAAEIADGVLRPGDRLPPQRNFAYERKIAVSTAGRVYAELLRRGLVVGEVGRGTFISGDAKRGASLIVWAIQEGREAAKSIDAYLNSGGSLREAALVGSAAG